jgi:hypothetical protein
MGCLQAVVEAVVVEVEILRMSMVAEAVVVRVLAQVAREEEQLCHLWAAVSSHPLHRMECPGLKQQEGQAALVPMVGVQAGPEADPG